MYFGIQFLKRSVTIRKFFLHMLMFKVSLDLYAFNHCRTLEKSKMFLILVLKIITRGSTRLQSPTSNVA